MQHLAPVGGVYQAGTLSGNPIATAAGLATLRNATPTVYDHVDTISASPAGRGRQRPQRRRCPARNPARRELVQRLLRRRWREHRPGLRHRREPVDHRVRRLLPFDVDSGVYLPPSAFEGWFLSAAHDDGAMDRIVAALPAAARRRL